MLDASSNDYEENVQQTALLCRLAHSIGVTVEAELGHIFQADIGVDALAMHAGSGLTKEEFQTAIRNGIRIFSLEV